jgi:phage terminase small subunit
VRKSRDGLTPKQRRFVREYVIDFCGAKAARRAGYSERVANRQAADLLSKPVIQAAVEKLETQVATSLEMSARDVRRLWRTIIDTTPESFVFEPDGTIRLAPGVDPAAWRAVASVRRRVRHLGGGGVEYETSLRLIDKNPTIKLVSQHHGLVKDAEDKPAQQVVVLNVVRQVVERDPDNPTKLRVIEASRAPTVREGPPGPAGQAAPSASDPADALLGGASGP